MNEGLATLDGTTSACAENTDLHGATSISLGNYLRVRGEYRHGGEYHRHIGELPPRARRIPYPQSHQ